MSRIRSTYARSRVIHCLKKALLLLGFFSGFCRAENTEDFGESETAVLPDESQLMRYGALPPKDMEPYDVSSMQNRREYKLEDFMWTGSGIGPVASDQDGGLAWEDNGGSTAGDTTELILVTKTLVLFKTVMTTVYPVDLTPTLILPTPELSSTPVISVTPSPSPTTSIEPTASPTETIGIEPSPTVSSTFEVLPTPSPTLPYDQKTPPPDETLPSPEHDTSASTNRLYWVKTVIKANGSEVLTHSNEFQSAMQKNLARVYASAFKRHLLSSLGVLDKFQNSSSSPLQIEPRRRRRRQSSNPERDGEDSDFEWLFARTGMSPSQLKSLATTAMNISVTILSITTDAKRPIVRMDYIVCAEGKPIPAASAVQDMSLVTHREMESEIGYEVIKKAEALIAAPPQSRQISEGSTSPWLIVAVTTICLLVILSVLLIYMVWKWKHNRLGDTNMSRPHSGIEGGVINPAFLGPPSPIERLEVRREHPAPVHARESTKSSGSRKLATEKLSGSGSTARRKQQKALATELNTLLTENGEKVSPSSIKSSSGTGSRSGSTEDTSNVVQVVKPTAPSAKPRRPKTIVPVRSPLASPVKRSSPRRRAVEAKRRRKKFEADAERESLEDRRLGTIDIERQQRPSSASSRDKVTLGHLDICPETVAQPISDEAKKFMSRDSSGQQPTAHHSKSKIEPGRRKTRYPETIAELPDPQALSSEESPGEQDREITESLQTVHAMLGSPTAGKSPSRTRVKGSARARGKVKPKSRSFPATASGTQHSQESLLSQESEEVIELHHMDDSSSETNPLGKMRRRFHQFLDDAFNVIGKKDDDEEEGRSKSAKVSISHQVERRESSRPWTSHVIHEESVENTRPKSASLGPPRRAWTASTEPRRCHSAKSDTSSGTRHGRADSVISEERDSDHGDEPDQNSSDLTSTTTDGNRSSFVSSAIIFPRYPIYPDIPYPTSSSGAQAEVPGTSQGQATPRPPDPAAPLIQAIKDEIKRFEKVKVTEQEFHPRRST